MKKPDFFLVGAAKAGTSSLFRYLKQHPRIFIPEVKEPNYFSDDPQVQSYNNLEDYLALYQECPPGSLAGDASTAYLYSPNAAARIKKFQPSAKILVILRNPIDRAYSRYWYNRRDFTEPLSFDAALDAEPRRIAEQWNYRFHYTAEGKYFEQLQRYYYVFPKDNIEVFLFDDLIDDPLTICRQIFSFLRLQQFSPNTSRIYNPSGQYRNQWIARLIMLKFPGRTLLRRIFPQFARSPLYARIRSLQLRALSPNLVSPPPMNEDTRAYLKEYFREDVSQLSDLLERDLTHWLS